MVPVTSCLVARFNYFVDKKLLNRCDNRLCVEALWACLCWSFLSNGKGL